MPVSADTGEDCAQDADMGLRMDGRTQAIESGRWIGADAARAFTNRGHALRAFEQLERPVEVLGLLAREGHHDGPIDGSFAQPTRDALHAYAAEERS